VDVGRGEDRWALDWAAAIERAFSDGEGLLCLYATSDAKRVTAHTLSADIGLLGESSG